MLELPILNEIHTSDLTSPCMRAVLHRLLGESLNVVPSAMARGLIAGATLEICHDNCLTEPDLVVEACKDALLNVRDSLSSEGRQFSDSVEANLEQIVLDVISMAGHYVERFGGRLVCCAKLGTEVPIRMTVEHPMFDEPVEFASHLDAIFRDTEGVFGMGKDRLIVWDWKWRKDAPTGSYLHRNMQLGMYALACLKGAICRNVQMDIWEMPCELPAVAWVHLPHLFPYKRKTVTKSGDGEETVFVKGDSRPEDRILQWVYHSHESLDTITDDFAQRVHMMQMGMFPKTVSVQGCQTCPSEQWCSRYDLEN